MKKPITATTAYRIKSLERGLILRKPNDCHDRVVLKSLNVWEQASTSVRSDWILLPDYDNRGLPLDEWQKLWDDLKADVEVLHSDGTWHYCFKE